MTDDADTISKKFRKARTDPAPLPETLDGLADLRRGAQPRRHLCRPHGPAPPGRSSPSNAGAGWGTFKPALADLAVDKLSPIAAEIAA